MRNKKIPFAVLSVVLITAIILPLISRAGDIGSGFIDDETEEANYYASAYGWDPAKMSAYEWDATIGNQQITMKRSADYQNEFLEDMTITTEQYLKDHGATDFYTASVTESGTGFGKGSGGPGGSSGGIGYAGSLARQIIEIANAEEGVSDNNIWYDEDGTRHSDKRNKFCDWYYNNSGFGADWCAIFVSWCANQVGLLSDGETEGRGTFLKTAGATNQFDYMVYEKGYASFAFRDLTCYGGSLYTPKPGDVFVIYDPTDGLWMHIGFVAEVWEDHFTSVEGNYSCKVSKNEMYPYLWDCFWDCRVISVPYPDTFSDTFVDETMVEGMYYELPAYNFLRSRGLPVSSTCGILGNMYCESRFEVDIENSIGAYGIVQWLGGRRQLMEAWMDANGYPYNSFEGQMYYLWYEITDTNYTDSSGWKMGAYFYENLTIPLLNMPEQASAARRAAVLWHQVYEISGNPLADKIRGDMAEETFWPKYSAVDSGEPIDAELPGPSSVPKPDYPVPSPSPSGEEPEETPQEQQPEQQPEQGTKKPKKPRPGDPDYVI